MHPCLHQAMSIAKCNKMSKLVLVIALFVAIQLASCSDSEHTPILQLKHGKVRGLVQDVGNGKKVEFYSGLRYGQAQRFEKPKPVAPWTGVYEATTTRDICPQFGGSADMDRAIKLFNLTTNEDCLYVNVWRPVEPKQNRSVMVWIHGGAFEIGTIFVPVFDGRYIAQLGDVVVVTLNYRLGPLGFANGGNVPANLGLHDQIFALKWVQENIHYFGGDPNQVTIFGESAGSISSGILLLSPLTKGLFKRAIMQSGAPTVHIVTEPLSSALERTKIYAKKLHCPIDGKLNDTMQCLRNKPLKELQTASINDFPQNHFFIPVYGDEVLPIRPDVALKEGKFNHVDLIYGITRDEGTGFIPQFIPEIAKEVTNLTIQSAKNDIIYLMNLFHRSEIGNEVADFYLSKLHNPTQDELKLAISAAFGDMSLVCPTVLFGEQFAMNSPMTSHIYAYRLMQEAASLPGFKQPKWMGVTHGMDGAYLFMPQVLHQSPPLFELSQKMIQAWTSFAKTGNPSVYWLEAFDRSTNDFSTRYMHLESAHYKMVSGFFKPTCDAFWKPKI